MIFCRSTGGFFGYVPKRVWPKRGPRAPSSTRHAPVKKSRSFSILCLGFMLFGKKALDLDHYKLNLKYFYVIYSLSQNYCSLVSRS